MEKGHLDDLPSPVQGRGMISNYANFLNLDGESVLLRFAEGLQLRRLERNRRSKSREPFLAGVRSGAPARPRRCAACSPPTC